MIPSYNAVLDRDRLTPQLEAIDLTNCGALAEPGRRFGERARRIDTFVDEKENELLFEIGNDLNVEYAKALSRAHAATSPSHLVLFRWSAVVPPPHEPSLEVLRAHLEAAEKLADEKVRRKLLTMRRGATAELRRLLGEWRTALDGAPDTLDPAERERAELAYGAAAKLDLDAAWPRVVFEELT